MSKSSANASTAQPLTPARARALVHGVCATHASAILEREGVFSIADASASSDLWFKATSDILARVDATDTAAVAALLAASPQSRAGKVQDALPGAYVEHLEAGYLLGVAVGLKLR